MSAFVYWPLHDPSDDGWASMLFRYGPARNLVAPPSLVTMTPGTLSPLVAIRWTTGAPTLNAPEDHSLYDPAPGDCGPDGVCRCGCGRVAWPQPREAPRRAHPRDGTEAWPHDPDAAAAAARADAVSAREVAARVWRAATGGDPPAGISLDVALEAVRALRGRAGAST